MFDYNTIYEFCKVRNAGSATSNGTQEYTPRIKFLLNLLENLGIEYEVDTFTYKGNNLHNIYLRGTSDKWFMAHHDVCNPKIDNANDNSASVMNCIALKMIRPDINVALVDGEEPPCMGAGSAHFSRRVNNKEINVDWVCNLELSCAGGTNFFIGNIDSGLSRSIKDKFDCAIMSTPFNDATIMNQYGINCCLINPCPLKEGWVIKQLGLTMDDEDNFDNNTGVNSDIEDDGFWGDWSSFFSSGKVFDFIEGDVIDDREYKRVLKSFPDNETLSDSDPNKFIAEYEVVQLESGKMPTLDQMDTSILWRCHSKDDTVEHVRTDEMKDFVEKVLAVICEL